MTQIYRIMTIAITLLLAPYPVNAAEKIKIVTSFSILADMAEHIGGDNVTVESLVGAGEDAHAFNPSPTDVTDLVRADLIIINGLGFEGWLDRLMSSTQNMPKIVVASAGISPLNAEDEKQGHKHNHGHDHGELDPHAWQNVANARIYAKNIASALIAKDPDRKSIYEANLARYDSDLEKLDKTIRNAIEAIPVGKRKLVTTHDAFGYFEEAYGIEMIAALGVANDAQPSAKDIARIIRQIRDEAVPAVFLETIIDPRLARRLSTESGAKIGGTLYSDALSEKNGPAGTYIAMMETNIRELTRALAP
jgi:zinc/manganese transport system substrate-binding protein